MLYNYLHHVFSNGKSRATNEFPPVFIILSLIIRILPIINSFAALIPFYCYQPGFSSTTTNLSFPVIQSTTDRNRKLDIT